MTGAPMRKPAPSPDSRNPVRSLPPSRWRMKSSLSIRAQQIARWKLLKALVLSFFIKIGLVIQHRRILLLIRLVQNGFSVLMLMK